MSDSENGLLNKEIGRCGVLCYMKIMNNDTVSVVMGGGYRVCRVYDVLYVLRIHPEWLRECMEPLPHTLLYGAVLIHIFS